MRERVHLTPLRIDELPSAGHPLAIHQWALIKQRNGWNAHPFLVSPGELSILLLSRKVGPFLIGYIPYADLREAGEEMLEVAAREMARLSGLRFTFIRFDLAYALESPESGRKYVHRCPFSIQPRATVLIDLSHGLEAVRSGYTKRARRALRKARIAEADTILCSGDGEEFDQWYELYLHTARRDGFLPRSRDYLRHVLSQKGTHLLYARSNGSMAGGIITLESTTHLLYLFGASEKDLPYPVGYLLQDGAIQYACDSGLSCYDLHGVGIDEKDHLSSLNLFKTSFGGAVVSREGSIDISFTSLRYVLYRFIENYRLKRARAHGLHE